MEAVRQTHQPANIQASKRRNFGRAIRHASACSSSSSSSTAIFVRAHSAAALLNVCTLHTKQATLRLHAMQHTATRQTSTAVVPRTQSSTVSNPASFMCTPQTAPAVHVPGFKPQITLLCMQL